MSCIAMGEEYYLLDKRTKKILQRSNQYVTPDPPLGLHFSDTDSERSDYPPLTVNFCFMQDVDKDTIKYAKTNALESLKITQESIQEARILQVKAGYIGWSLNRGLK